MAGTVHWWCGDIHIHRVNYVVRPRHVLYPLSIISQFLDGEMLSPTPVAGNVSWRRNISRKVSLRGGCFFDQQMLLLNRKSKQNVAENQDSPKKVEPEPPPKMDNCQVSTYTISDDDWLSSHSCDLLNTSVVSSLADEANEYEKFPPTQLSEKGDVFASLAQGHDEYREAALQLYQVSCVLQQTTKCLKICLYIYMYMYM